ncbi:MAG: ribosomal protein S18-alanine N-acetyltransferase [Candidatus Competibacteraceae bacterium]|jgi:ribosomal-protein-alanine N-acetyltransferase|nr:ribosomal protein S18-alanine N-acetyltransferase [Candidatus Competibacteraceae bacterium]
MSAVPENFSGRFRAMGHFDLAEVMAIETQAYPFPWTEGIIRDCLRIGYRCRILEVQGRIEAYGILSVGAGEAHILNLCVRPESCGQGLARAMLCHLLDVARINSAMTIFLEVRPSNPRAVSLYQRAGFCEVGVRKDYYPATSGREDALVMAKEL